MPKFQIIIPISVEWRHSKEYIKPTRCFYERIFETKQKKKKICRHLSTILFSSKWNVLVFNDFVQERSDLNRRQTYRRSWSFDMTGQGLATRHLLVYRQRINSQFCSFFLLVLCHRFLSINDRRSRCKERERCKLYSKDYMDSPFVWFLFLPLCHHRISTLSSFV